MIEQARFAETAIFLCTMTKKVLQRFAETANPGKNRAEEHVNPAS